MLFYFDYNYIFHMSNYFMELTCSQYHGVYVLAELSAAKSSKGIDSQFLVKLFFIYYTPTSKNVGVLCSLIMLYRCHQSVPFTLSSHLLLNPLGDFDEIWHKERSHCGDMHICKGNPVQLFLRSYGPWTEYFL
jgi:hypothetical protein